jgi:signal transduction histidine kinase
VEKNREKELMMLNQARLAQMGQVLNMIAHQWRQPLNNLMLVNQTLVLKYKRSQGKINSKDMEEFKSNSAKLINQMSKTIDDFRDFFKPKKATELFCLNDMLEQLIGIVEPVFENLQISLQYKAEEKVFIKGYANELAQALLNILYNAKDALCESETKQRQIELFLYKKEDSVIIRICDNAGGIPDDIIDKIFNPYFSTKEEKNGTGLGLYMSKLIIQKHANASLNVYNEKEGAVFEIEFHN